MFIGMGCDMYFLWARKQGFWPYDDDKADDSDLEEWEHMIVFVAAADEDEFTVLERRLNFREKEIKQFENLSKNSYSVVAQKDRDLTVSHKFLDNKSYKIMQLVRKLDEQESKIEDLTNTLSEISTRSTHAQIKNVEMRKHLHELQAKYGIMEDDEDDISSEHDEVHDDVYTWSLEQVLDWWRRNLPRSAQQHTQMVRDSQITGRNPLELDMGMLQEFGMKKLLARQIISQIELLRIDCNNPHGSHH